MDRSERVSIVCWNVVRVGDDLGDGNQRVDICELQKRNRIGETHVQRETLGSEEAVEIGDTVGDRQEHRRRDERPGAELGRLAVRPYGEHSADVAEGVRSIWDTIGE